MFDAVLAPPQPPRPTRSRAATRELWLDRLARFPASGLTVAQFCAIEAVSLPSFYAWRRRLAAEVAAEATPQDPGNDLGPRLLPVRLQPAAAAVELVLPTGAVLRLPPGCDLAWVRSLVAALGGSLC
jgi:transposase